MPPTLISPLSIYTTGPSPAEAALKSAVALNPNLPPEIQALEASQL